MQRRPQTIARRAAPFAAVLFFAVSACSSLLDVNIPGSVQASDLDDPALAQTMVNSAIGEFQCGYGQYVVTTGIISDEYRISGFSVGSNNWGWRGDAEIRAASGDCSAGTGYGFYTALQRGRFLAEDYTRRVEAFPDALVPAKADKLAQLAAYAGYSNALLGEGMCSMTVDLGPLMTRAQVFSRAEDWFTKAITLARSASSATLGSDIKAMAFVGRARVRMDLGNGAAAAADADSVPANYVRVAEYSSATTRRNNKVWSVSINANDLTVTEAYRGLTVGSPPVADTRVRAVFANRQGTDGYTDQWNQQKYPANNSTIPLASWREAQLIIAEVRGGAAAITALNAVRTSLSLPPLTAAEQANLPATVVEERRRTLFSEGQRIGDMLRLGIPFPSGTNKKGQNYGSVTCVPLPDIETVNNPNL